MRDHYYERKRSWEAELERLAADLSRERAAHNATKEELREMTRDAFYQFGRERGHILSLTRRAAPVNNQRSNVYSVL